MSVADVSLYLKGLLEEYHSNTETLAKYFSLNVESVYQIVQRNMQVLPDGFMERAKILDKMMFLTMIPEGLSNLEVKASLETVLSYHRLSKETITGTAGIEIADADLFLSDQCKEANTEVKYKIAAVTMVLRSLSGDNEPEQQSRI